MSIPLNVNNNVYNYPSDGEPPGWGGDATAWAEAVTEVLSTLLGPADIIQTSALIQNNNVAPSNVNDLIFDPGIVRAANISYSVFRVSSTTLSGTLETGTIYITYDNSAAPGSKWIFGQNKIGDAGVTFSITDAGQLQYISTDIGAASYQGNIKFSAKALLQ